MEKKAEVNEAKIAEKTDEHVLKDLGEEESSMKHQSQIVVYGLYSILIVLGVLTGYLLSRSTSGMVGIPGKTSPQTTKTEKVVGSTDTKTFKDSAEGTIEKGGIDGEGTHKLIREGGPSQTAFLISSVVDLDEYVGKKVKVWGETFAAKKASWLMDVGKIEIFAQ